jgi:hypothetical protein
MKVEKAGYSDSLYKPPSQFEIFNPLTYQSTIAPEMPNFLPLSLMYRPNEIVLVVHFQQSFGPAGYDMFEEP